MNRELKGLLERNKVRRGLLYISIMIIPILIFLDQLAGRSGRIFNIGMPISISTISYLWVLYYLYLSKNASK